MMKCSKMFRVLYCFVLCVVVTCSIVPTQSGKAATKLSYSMKKKEVKFKDGKKIRGIISFEYPQFGGSSSSIKKINKVLENDAKVFMKSGTATNLKEYVNDAIKNKYFYDENEQYIYKTLVEVTYNQNSVISIAMSNQWYAGGVYNQDDYGYNFNTKTGNKLYISDVITGNDKTVRNKIYTGVQKYYKTEISENKSYWSIVKALLDEYKMKDFNFYLTKGKAHICFGSYELNQGTSFFDIAIKSKY